ADRAPGPCAADRRAGHAVVPLEPRRDGLGGRDRALGVRTGPEPAVRYPGRPDGRLPSPHRRAPRLRRRGGACRGRMHGCGLRTAGRLMASLEVGIVGLPNSGKTSLFNLLISDQVLVDRRRERTERAARVGEKSARDELVVLEQLSKHLNEGQPARTLDVVVPEGLDLLTTKPVIYVANVSEAGEPKRV